jgi:hypothetical protein
MSPANHSNLYGRVVSAAYHALKRQHYVSAIDVLLGMGWLQQDHLDGWRQGRTPYLERVVQSSLTRISEAMRIFRRWAEENGLKPSETAYVMRKPGRQVLRFSKSGNPSIERLYRTHWVSPVLSERKADRLKDAIN